MLVQSFDGFALVGCYAEPDHGRALGNLYSDEAKTCVSHASSAACPRPGFVRECWYGDASDSNASQQKPEAGSCGFPCPGDPSQYCGAGNRLALYHR